MSDIRPASLGKAKVLTTTQKAIRVRLLEETGPHYVLWIPQSAVHDDSEVWKMGDVGELVVHNWFAVAKRLG